MRARLMRAAFALAALVPAVSAAQSRLLGTRSWEAGPVYKSWTFGTPVLDDTVEITSAWQVAIPVAVAIPLGARWTFDVSTAYATGEVRRERGAAFELSGLTDTRLRVVGRPFGEHLALTFGVNAPTGTTNLDDAQLAALRVLSAPALSFPVPVYGSGFGGLAGVVLARRAGGWALAVGSSFEMRGRYSPVDAVIAGVSSPLDLEPAHAIHFSLGADRLLGRHRLSWVALADVYGDDRVSSSGPTGSAAASYHLGPSAATSVQIDIASSRVRDLALFAAARYRSQYADGAGTRVAGSSGGSLEGGVSGTIGRPSLGLVVRLDGRYDTGMDVDNSLITAAATSGGITLGVALPIGPSVLQPFVRGQFGRIDSGSRTGNMSAVTAGITLRSRARAVPAE